MPILQIWVLAILSVFNSTTSSELGTPEDGQNEARPPVQRQYAFAFRMKHLYLIAGVAGLGIVAATTDIGQSAAIAQRVGWGFLVILGIFAIEFLVDVISWQYTFENIPTRPKWTYRLWQIKMIGEALNLVLAAGHFGGEPVKALLLKKRVGLTYGEAIASLVLARTVITMSLVIFLAFGLLAAAGIPQIGDAERTAAAFGFGGFCIAIALFFLIQRLRLTSVVTRTIFRGRLAAKLAPMLEHLHKLENRLVTFYTQRPLKLAISLAFAFSNWVFGVTTIYFTFYFLGHDVTFQEAWVIEAFTQMVRASTFFIPASIGAQESAFVLVITAITGNPALGLAVAIVRRGREIVWICLGLAIGWRMEAFGPTNKMQLKPSKPKGAALT